MTLSIAHLGPPGTYAEQAAIGYVNWLQQQKTQEVVFRPCVSIAQTLRAIASHQADIGVVPVENSIEGSVAITLDTLWQLDTLQIQLALVLPIAHTLLSHAPMLDTIQTVYSHPQALAQCQRWLEQYLPKAQLIPSNSTTEALQHLAQNTTAAAISSLRASELYNLPVLADSINDYPDNCTRFWVLSQRPLAGGDAPSSGTRTHTTLGFSLQANVPGALVKPLQIFAEREINLSRIESRPTKRSLGEYLFFIDIEADADSPLAKSAFSELATYTEVLKIFGSYNVIGVERSQLKD